MEAFTSLKCQFCKGYLSLPPITTTNLNGTEYKCGRCENIITTYNVRNHALENIAQYVPFPCMNADCGQIVAWKEVKEHELACPHRTFVCPDFTCMDVIKVSGIREHYLEKHKDCNLDNYQFQLSESVTYNGLARCVLKNNIPFIVYLTWNYGQITNRKNQAIPHQKNPMLPRRVYNMEPRSIFITVLCLSNTEMTYHLTLTSSDTASEQVVISDQKIDLFNDRDHCSKCNFTTCTFPYHDKRSGKMANTFIKQNTLVNHWMAARKPIQITLKITDANKTSNANDDLQLNPKRMKMYDDFRCPICMEYLSTPIYTCKIGHSVCNDCKKNMDECPLCKAKYEGSRNFALENVIGNIEVQCVNEKNGCKFVGNLIMLREHEKVCSK